MSLYSDINVRRSCRAGLRRWLRCEALALHAQAPEFPARKMPGMGGVGVHLNLQPGEAEAGGSIGSNGQLTQLIWRAPGQ